MAVGKKTFVYCKVQDKWVEPHERQHDLKGNDQLTQNSMASVEGVRNYFDEGLGIWVDNIKQKKAYMKEHGYTINPERGSAYESYHEHSARELDAIVEKRYEVGRRGWG